MRRAAPALVLIAGFAAMAALNWPGQLSYDSVIQLAEGRAGFYHSWHPPVMAFLLGLFDRLLPGAALFMLFTAGLALFALLVFTRRGGWAAALMALLLVLSPQILLYQGLVWKDVLFADAALAGFAALLLAAENGTLWLLPSALLLALAAMTRQNGLVILPVAAVTVALLARHSRHSYPALRGALFLGITLGVTLGGDAWLASHGDHGADATAELRLAQAYDLSAMLARDPSLPLAVLQAADPGLAAALRGPGARLYSPQRIDGFEDDPSLYDAVEKAPPHLVFSQWRQALLSHPGLYLSARWQDFWWVLAMPDRLACRPLYIGVDGPPATLKALGLGHRWRPQDRLLAAYGQLVVRTPVFSHLLFAGLALCLFVWLAWRGKPADLAVAGMLAAALAFAASFFVVSVACDYRYLYFLDLGTWAAAIYIVQSRRPLTR